jgi:hypothetical protein
MKVDVAIITAREDEFESVINAFIGANYILTLKHISQ